MTSVCESLNSHDKVLTNIGLTWYLEYSILKDVEIYRLTGQSMDIIGTSHVLSCLESVIRINISLPLCIYVYHIVETTFLGNTYYGKHTQILHGL